MKKSIAVVLFFMLFLFACAPAAPVSDPGVAVATVEPTTAAAEPTPEPAATDAPAGAAEPAPLPVATSRGDELHATDPSTVQLGAGRPVLVEFFRFT